MRVNYDRDSRDNKGLRPVFDDHIIPNDRVAYETGQMVLVTRHSVGLESAKCVIIKVRANEPERRYKIVLCDNSAKTFDVCEKHVTTLWGEKQQRQHKEAARAQRQHQEQWGEKQQRQHKEAARAQRQHQEQTRTQNRPTTKKRKGSAQTSGNQMDRFRDEQLQTCIPIKAAGVQSIMQGMISVSTVPDDVVEEFQSLLGKKIPGSVLTQTDFNWTDFIWDNRLAIYTDNFTVFEEAIRERKNRLVEYYLRGGLDIMKVRGWSCTIYIAIRYSNREAVRLHIDAMKDLRYQGKYYRDGRLLVEAIPKQNENGRFYNPVDFAGKLWKIPLIEKMLRQAAGLPIEDTMGNAFVKVVAHWPQGKKMFTLAATRKSVPEDICDQLVVVTGVPAHKWTVFHKTKPLRDGRAFEKQEFFKTRRQPLGLDGVSLNANSLGLRGGTTSGTCGAGDGSKGKGTSSRLTSPDGTFNNSQFALFIEGEYAVGTSSYGYKKVNLWEGGKHKLEVLPSGYMRARDIDGDYSKDLKSACTLWNTEKTGLIGVRKIWASFKTTGDLWFWIRGECTCGTQCVKSNLWCYSKDDIEAAKPYGAAQYINFSVHNKPNGQKCTSPRVTINSLKVQWEKY